jgi:hypothetical protein
MQMMMVVVIALGWWPLPLQQAAVLPLKPSILAAHPRVLAPAAGAEAAALPQRLGAPMRQQGGYQPRQPCSSFGLS